MAYVRIQIDDDTLDLYGSYDPRGAAFALARQVERFKNYRPTERVLVFSPEEALRLQRLTGGASATAEIVDRVENAARVVAGPATVVLEERLVRLAEQKALRQGLSVKELLQRELQDALRYAIEG